MERYPRGWAQAQRRGWSETLVFFSASNWTWRVRGLFHTLLNMPTHTALESHPKVGASWEGFVLGEVITRLGVYPEECFFWATHGGAELDLLVVCGTQRWGFECKRTAAPRLTRSMRAALADLHLERLDVIHAGEHTFALADTVRAVALRRLFEDLRPLR